MGNFEKNIYNCCSDPKICIFAFCIPGGVCCLQAAAVDIGYGQGKFIPYLFPLCLGCIGGAVNRYKIRERFSLEGTAVNDLVVWCFLPFCAAVQEYKETHKDKEKMISS